MENSNSQISNPVISQANNMQPQQPQRPRMLVLLFGIIALIVLIILGFIIFYLGSLYGKSNSAVNDVVNEKTEQEKVNDTKTQLSEDTPVSLPDETAIDECNKVFSSTLIELSFEYDSCLWNIEEKENIPENATYAVISATHNSKNILTIEALTLGMGGGYPNCSVYDSYEILPNNLVRVQMPASISIENDIKIYNYFNINNDYAIKDKSGDFGNEKFKEYLSYLNTSDIPGVNFCWRSAGMNAVQVLTPKSNQTAEWQINKDIELKILDINTANPEFLKDADELATTIFQSIED